MTVQELIDRLQADLAAGAINKDTVVVRTLFADFLEVSDIQIEEDADYIDVTFDGYGDQARQHYCKTVVVIE